MEMCRELVSLGMSFQHLLDEMRTSCAMFRAYWGLCSCITLASSPHLCSFPLSKAFPSCLVPLMVLTFLPGSGAGQNKLTSVCNKNM